MQPLDKAGFMVTFILLEHALWPRSLFPFGPLISPSSPLPFQPSAFYFRVIWGLTGERTVWGRRLHFQGSFERLWSLSCWVSSSVHFPADGIFSSLWLSKTIVPVYHIFCLLGAEEQLSWCHSLSVGSNATANMDEEASVTLSSVPLGVFPGVVPPQLCLFWGSSVVISMVAALPFTLSSSVQGLLSPQSTSQPPQPVSPPL